MNATSHRQKADRTAQDILAEKHREALGRDGTVEIERPSTILRRRLLEEQGLVISGPASLGSDRLERVKHWEDDAYLAAEGESADAFIDVPAEQTLRLTLLDALQIGARNSTAYQDRKESVFQRALSLYERRHEFRTTFAGSFISQVSVNTRGDDTVSNAAQSGTLDATQKLYSGGQIGAGLGIDLANLLTGGGASSLGLTGDATVSLPLLRGAGRHIVMEPLTQAERDLVYEIWDFEQYKKTFAVQVASNYLTVLQRLDAVYNSRENYRSVISSARRSRRLADAGRLKEIDVDQASQSELRARQGWISAMESYQNSLNSFKSLIGLPPDADVELDPNDLRQLVAPTLALREHFLEEAQADKQKPALSADAPIELSEPTREDAGPWELEEEFALRLALENRLDFRHLIEAVYDAQRKAVIAANRLGAELTLGGRASFGESRGVGSATSDDARFRFDEGLFSGVLTLNLPLERTAEQVAYRNSLISLERTVRTVQSQEDSIKLSVSNTLSTMRQARENLYIQTQAVIIAEKRVRSVTLFLDAGRAAMRDLLEAQDALLSAQNGLTSAAVGYRVAELELQRNLGLLDVDERGLWQEALPEELKNAEK